jgi:hypothetical protein
MQVSEKEDPHLLVARWLSEIDDMDEAEFLDIAKGLSKELVIAYLQRLKASLPDDLLEYDRS